MSIIKVKTGGITADAITDALIADDVVGTEHLTANEVDTTALGADAVTAAQIADDAISEEHLDVTAITGHAALTSVADDDLVLLSDTSASAALKKMTVANLVANAGGGKINQVLQATNSTQQDLNSNSSFVDLAGVTQAITPSATSSKILIISDIHFDLTAGDRGFQIKILRDSTVVFEDGNNKSTYTAGARIAGRNTYLELDAPSSSSSLTYKVQVQTDGNSGARFNPESGRSNITLIEVLA